LFIFFHGKSDGKKHVFYRIKNIINTPVIVILLSSQSGTINKQEENGRKIEQKRDDYPEFLRIINVKYTGVFDLLVQEENAVEDQQAGLQARRQGVKTCRSFVQDIDERNRVE
jgi:hypothetical protein